jgi:hypothetical protein
MTMAFSEFLTSLFTTLERQARPYVVYRDDSDAHRMVVRVDSEDRIGDLEKGLIEGGFVPADKSLDDGTDFLWKQTGPEGDVLHVVQVKAGHGGGKTAANLLWRAATDESAAAARASLRHDDDPS